MTSFPVRPRVALAGGLALAGLLTGGAVAAADPSPSGAATADPSASAEQQQQQGKAEQQRRKAERKAEQQRRKAERPPGRATDRSRAPAVTDPAFVCDPALSHGQNVSAYARSLPKGPGRGRLVSAAARTDCGRPGD